MGSPKTPVINLGHLLEVPGIVPVMEMIGRQYEEPVHALKGPPQAGKIVVVSGQHLLIRLLDK